MTWVAVAVAGAGLVGSVVSSQGAKSAAKTAAQGSDAAAAEAARQFDTVRGDNLGRINIGNQAINALGSMYGYTPTPMGGNALAQPTTTAQGPGGSSSGGNFFTSPTALKAKEIGVAGMDPIGAGLLTGVIGGGHSGSHWRNWDAFNKAFPGTTVNPDGTYKLPNGSTVNQQQLDNLAGTYYGATFAPDGNQAQWQQQYKDAVNQYAPGLGAPPQGNAVGSQTSDGVPNSAPMQVGGAPGNPAGTPGTPNYGAFFMSPDYQFRKDQGMQGIQNSFSASGGAKSGNALKALADFNSNLAGGEFGNYFNRQLALAGQGQAATSTSAGAGIATGQIVGNALQNSSDARASGVAGSYNALGAGLSGVGQGLGYYMQQRGSPYSGQGSNSYYNWNFPG